MPRIALGVLGGLWGSRLALHLWHRVRHEEEDGRYRYLRQYWHGHQGKIFGFFMAQALLIVLFALPFVAVAANPRADLTLWVVAAALVWLLSVGGESLADRQLARFRADPANRAAPAARALALFPPPQLLLRVAALVHLCPARGRLATVVAGLGRPAADVRVPALSERHSIHRETGAAQPRRRLSRLPAQYTDVLSWFPRSSKEHSA
jgi:hypothetical protein